MTGRHPVTSQPVARPAGPATDPYGRWALADPYGLARGGMLNLAGAACAGLAGLGVAWLVARGLGQAPAGVFFAATAAFTLATGVARLGTGTGTVYWIARLRAQGRPDLAAACVRVATGPVVVAATVLAGAGWLAAPWLAGTVVGSPQGTWVLRVLAVFLPLAALTETWLAGTRGWRAMRPTVALDRLLRPGLQLVLIGTLAAAALWTSTPLPVPAWAVAWALPWLPVAALAAYAVRRTQARAGRGAAGRSAPPAAGSRTGTDRSLAGRYWRFTGPRAVASVLHLALQRLDILLVAMLLGPAAAAVYTVAGRFVVLGQLVNQAVGLAVQPRLAERLGVGDAAAAGALFRTATGWLVLLVWPFYLLIAVHATVYLGLFGAGYQHAAPVVAVLAGAMLLATGCGMIDMVLAMAGRTSWNLLNVTLALIAMVAVDLVLIPRLGVLGAAIGLAAAVAVNNLLPLAQVAYTLRIHPFGRATVSAAALAVACFGVLPPVVAAVAGRGMVAATAGLLAGVTLYAAGAGALRRPLALDVLAALRPRNRSLNRPRDHAGQQQGEPHAQ